jgi:nanoRNase/pAp phosphatase (c-di-AMP/oligoRNAs hydrolase)
MLNPVTLRSVSAEGAAGTIPVAIKTANDSASIRNNVMKAMHSMQSPLIATHFRPDEDALGSSIAMAIHLRNLGNNPSLFLREGERMPKFLNEIIQSEGINIVHSVSTRYHDGLILLDTAKAGLLEEQVQELLDSTENIVDIDHHLGEEVMAKPELTLVSDKVSSAAEMVANLFDDSQINENMAKALMAGILGDTKNLNFMVKKNTRYLIEKLERISGTERNDLFALLNDLSEADKAFINECLESTAENTVIVAGQPYNLKWVVVHKGKLNEEHRNWRKTLQDELGFARKADIVLIIYYDPHKGKYRGSLSAFNNGTKLDFRPTAKEISDGGGHPGAVGFDFALGNYENNSHAITYILDMLSRHGKLKDR